MFDEITRILNHLMWLGAHGLDIGAMTVFLFCFTRARGPDGRATRRSPARACTPPTTARAASTATCPTRCRSTRPRSGASQKDADAPERGARGLACWISSRPSPTRFPACVDDYETLLTDNRIWKQRTVNIGVVTPGARDAARLLRSDAARLRRGLGPAQEAALRGLRPHGLRHPGRASTATATTATWCASRRCASRTASSASASSGCARNPGPVMIDDRKVRAAAAAST